MVANCGLWSSDSPTSAECISGPARTLILGLNSHGHHHPEQSPQGAYADPAGSAGCERPAEIQSKFSRLKSDNTVHIPRCRLPKQSASKWRGSRLIFVKAQPTNWLVCRQIITHVALAGAYINPRRSEVYTHHALLKTEHFGHWFISSSSPSRLHIFHTYMGGKLGYHKTSDAWGWSW